MCWVLRALARGERRVQEVVEALAVLEPAVHQQQVTERVRQVAHRAALRQPATQGEADEWHSYTIIDPRRLDNNQMAT